MQKWTRLSCVLGIVCAVTTWLLLGQRVSATRLPRLAAAETVSVNFPQWFYESDQAAATLGFSVSGTGDFNGDGCDDLLVGAPKYSDEVYKAGAIFVFYGSEYSLAALPQWHFGGDQTGADLGFAVAAAGDVNGDGFDDLVVGAPRYNHEQPREGRVYAFYGSPGGLSLEPDWWVESDLAEAHLGWAVATAGDVNEDGFADVLIGAKWAQDSFINEGMAQVYLGGDAGLEEVPAWTVFGGQAGASLGTAVSPAGDINHDGYADVAVGLPLYNASDADVGKVEVFCGGEAGPGQIPCWESEGTQPEGRLGQALSGAGDVNGDGYDDLLVGVPGQDGAVPDAGAVVLYLGGPLGLASVAGWTVVSDQSFAQFGSAVALGGDVNGDGLDDLIIGSYVYSADQPQEGRIFVYAGVTTGPGLQPDWLAEGNKAEAEFGFAISSGDSNGDGLDEVFVGAPNYRKETELRGRVFLFEALSSNGQTSTLFLPLILNQ